MWVSALYNIRGSVCGPCPGPHGKTGLQAKKMQKQIYGFDACIRGETFLARGWDLVQFNFVCVHVENLFVKCW